MSSIRRLAAWHPEWWILLLSAGAWCVLLGPGLATAGSGMLRPCPACQAGEGWLRSLNDWVLMVLAMMLPLMLVPVRVTAFESLWRRRHLAVGVFLSGYTFVWALAGVASILLLAWLKELHVTPGPGWASAGFLAAVAWQGTACKRRLLTACHRTMPLAPNGWRANRDCLQFGASQGIYCVSNCGPLMFAAMLSPWHVATMIAVTVILFYERYWERPGKQTVRRLLGLLAVCQLFLSSN